MANIDIAGDIAAKLLQIDGFDRLFEHYYKYVLVFSGTNISNKTTFKKDFGTVTQFVNWLLSKDFVNERVIYSSLPQGEAKDDFANYILVYLLCACMLDMYIAKGDKSSYLAPTMWYGDWCFVHDDYISSDSCEFNIQIEAKMLNPEASRDAMLILALPWKFNYSIFNLDTQKIMSYPLKISVELMDMKTGEILMKRIHNISDLFESPQSLTKCLTDLLENCKPA